MTTDETHDAKGRKGTAWTLIGYGSRQVIRMASNLILTRLLVPEFFGTMLVVNTLYIGVHLFTDVGIGPSVVQNERGDDPDFLNTAFTIQSIRGFLLFIAMLVLAVPTAHFYEDPILARLLPFVGLAALFQGLFSTSMATYRRHVWLKQLTLLHLGEQLVSTVVMVTWALIEPTVWALAAGSVAGSFSVMVASHLLLKGPRNRFHIDRPAMGELIRFGRWIFLSTLMMYLVSYSDRLVVSKLVAFEVAGVYSIAVMIAELPAHPLASISSDVAFPIFSRVHGTGKRLFDLFCGFRRPLNAVGGWAIAGLLAGAPLGVEILWTEPYWDAGWMVQILVVGIYVGNVLVSSNNAALLAMGHSRLMAATSVAKLIGMSILMPLGYLSFGMPGLISGFSASQLCPYLVSVWGVTRFGLNDTASDMRLILRVTATGAIGYGVGWMIVNAGAPKIVAAVALAIVVTALWWDLLGPVVARVKAGGSPFELADSANG